MISRTAFCSAHPATMREARQGPIPDLVRRSGSSSMMSKVFAEHRDDALGHRGPMPRICPEADISRYPQRRSVAWP